MYSIWVLVLVKLAVSFEVSDKVMEELTNRKFRCYDMEKDRYDEELLVSKDTKLTDTQMMIRSAVLSDRITNFKEIPDLTYCIKDPQLLECFHQGYQDKKNVKVTFDTLDYSMTAFIDTFEEFFADRVCLYACHTDISYTAIIYAMKAVAETVCDCKFETAVLIKECSMAFFVYPVLDCVADYYMERLCDRVINAGVEVDLTDVRFGSNETIQSFILE